MAEELVPTPDTVPYAPPNFGPPTDDALARELARPPAARGEAMEATFHLLKMKTFGTVLENEIKKRQESKNGPKLTPQQLNDLYPELDEKFNSGYTAEEAKVIVDRYHERKRQEEIVSAGPRDVLGVVGNFAAGIAASVTDPVELGLNLFVTGGIGLIGRAAYLGRSAQLLSATEKAAKLRAFSALRSSVPGVLAENIAAGVLMEPARLAMTRSDLEEQNITDTFRDVVGSALGFSALHWSAHKLISKIRGPNIEGVTHESAVMQLAADKRPNVEPMIDSAHDQMRSNPRGVFSGQRAAYEFRPLEEGDFKTRGFYHGTRSAVTNILQSDLSQVGENLGRGLYLTDNPNVAHGVGGGAGSPSDGSVFSVGLDNLKLLDLDKPAVGPIKELIREQLARALSEDGKPRYAEADRFLNPKPFFTRSFSATSDSVQVLGKAALPENKGITGGGNLRDVFDKIHEGIADGKIDPSVLDDLVHLMSEHGYDGYRHTGGHEYDLDSQNIVMLFDPKAALDSGKLQALDVEPSNKGIVPSPSQDQLRGYAEERLARESDIDHDPVEFKKFEELSMRPLPEDNPADVLKAEEAAVESLGQMDELGHMTDQDRADLEAIREAKREHLSYEKALNYAMNCVGVE